MKLSRLLASAINGRRASLSPRGVMSHSELAAWTNTEKHNITTLVERMKKDGLVTSDYSNVDRRVAHITVTEKLMLIVLPCLVAAELTKRWFYPHGAL